MEHYINLMRIDKPIGILLLLWPTLWALWLANGGMPSFSLLAIFSIGTFCMRTAGCIINDLVDLKFDSKVARTKDRALVSGQITKFAAVLVLIILLLISLLLVSMLNVLSIKIAAIGLVFTIIYPFLKRYTGMVQLFLGLTFALGIPIAFAATKEHVVGYAWVLYSINVIWIIAFDSIYAMLDKHDDLKIGVHSSAILFGEHDQKITFLLQLIVSLSLMTFGIMLELGGWYQGCVLITLILFVYQYKLMFIGHYMLAFINNNWVGAIIFLGFILADYSKVYTLN